MRRPFFWLLLALALAALAAGLGWLLLRGDEDATPGNDQATTRAPLPRARALPPAEQLALAFRAAFGAAGEARRTVGDQTYVYAPERLEWIGGRAALISLGRNGNNCHACGGAMAVHYLRPESNGFRVTGAWLDTDASSSNGEPPHEIAIIRELSDYPVVYASGGGTWQGQTCTWARLVELRPEAPVTSDSILMSHSNAGNVDPVTGRTFGGDPAIEIEGRIVNIRRSRSFDVAFTGTERFSETYRYRGNRWVGPDQESREAC